MWRVCGHPSHPERPYHSQTLIIARVCSMRFPGKGTGVPAAALFDCPPQLNRLLLDSKGPFLTHIGLHIYLSDLFWWRG